MSLLSLPPEVLYDILGEVVASYVERAITSPPVDGWETMDSEGESEWHTDDEDESDIEGLESGVYDSLGNDDYSGPSDASEDDDDYDDEADSEFSDDEALSSLRAFDDTLDDSMESGSDERDEDSAAPSGTLADALGVPDDILSLLEQERSFDPEDMLSFKLCLWDTIERREKLPANDIASLLSVCHVVREITVKLVSDALGFDITPNESADHNPWSLLRYLRRHYRIAHTQPFELTKAEYPARATPLVGCYLILSGLGYTLRHLDKLAHMDPSAGCVMVRNIFDIISIAEEIPQHVFRPRISRRAHALLVHMSRYISVSMHCSEIGQSYKEMFSLKGSSRRPGFIIHEDKIPQFTDAIQAFATFDRKHMDRKRYPELPGPLVDLCGVVRALGNIKKLKYVAEFRKHPDIMAATEDAVTLLEKWKRRADISSYVVFEL